ncbi:hypothetical protein [Dyella choica]|uniref:Baseplate protein J-like domain-containing protein n=1 Tax=Dyella choica TaxID=1927959 RepID=A0A432M9A1_9GAMM|nr:hypothetical protein [Dyella choica]RUL78804.1 hypothetical protein EKH80_03050 [Dyella choica]
MSDVSALENLLSSLVAGEGFKLDNRSIESNLAFVEQYARLIPYEDPAGRRDQECTWADILFMGGNTPQKLAAMYQDRSLAAGTLWPQQALLLAVLQMLETPRALLNYFPYAHRQLYYRQLLGLSERAAEPARVALAFQLAATTAELLIPADTPFSAGQDRQGVPVQYALDRSLLANHGEWSDLYWRRGGTDALYIAYDREQGVLWPEQGRRLFGALPEQQCRLGTGETFDEPRANEKDLLYLGFAGLRPGQTLSLFWQLQGAKALNMTWQYADAQGHWAPLDATVIDETAGLFRSGCWSAILPKDIGGDDAGALAPPDGLPPGRCWLRALIDNAAAPAVGASDYPVVFGLLTNGMTATMQNPAALDPSSLSQPLPANSMAQPVSAIAGLSKTLQPWPSWGGRPAEVQEAFFERVARRLEHRNRALTWQDMVSILKARYSAVFEVATPSSIKQTTMPAAREQRLIVIPLNTEKDNDDPVRPLLNQAKLQDMQNTLQRLASPWQNIVLENPAYRDVSIDYSLTFQPGVNPDYGLRQVRQALEQHYMPWIEDRPGGVKLGGKLDYYDVVAQIQRQPLVDRVNRLELNGKKASVEGEDHEALVLVWPVEALAHQAIQERP